MLRDVAEKSSKKTGNSDRVYCGLYLSNDDFKELCDLLQIPIAVGGSSAFRKLLSEYIRLSK